MGRQHQGMDRPGVRQVPEGSGEQGKMEKTGCKIICGVPMTLAVKGLMMMMTWPDSQFLRNVKEKEWNRVIEESVSVSCNTWFIITVSCSMFCFIVRSIDDSWVNCDTVCQGSQGRRCLLFA